MRIYFTLKEIPELSMLPSKERRKVWRAVSWKGLKHWQTWLGVLINGLYMSSGVVVLISGLDHIENIILMVTLFFLALLPAFAGCMIFSSLAIEQVRPYIRDFLKTTNN